MPGTVYGRNYIFLELAGTVPANVSPALRTAALPRSRNVKDKTAYGVVDIPSASMFLRTSTEFVETALAASFEPSDDATPAIIVRTLSLNSPMTVNAAIATIATMMMYSTIACPLRFFLEIFMIRTPI